MKNKRNFRGILASLFKRKAEPATVSPIATEAEKSPEPRTEKQPAPQSATAVVNPALVPEEREGEEILRLPDAAEKDAASVYKEIASEADFVAGVRADFDRRVEARRSLETQWRLNTLFYLGKQNYTIGASGVPEEYDDDFLWRDRSVYNHIAAVVETRLAKLARVRPSLAVRPASSDQDDVRTAKAASKILNAVSSRIELSALLREATVWSELAGSVFYKVVWDGGAGKRLKSGKCEGDVRVEVCPPYEIYPEDLALRRVEDQPSIIHARSYPVDEIERAYGVRVNEERVESFSVLGDAPTTRKGCALVIERYVRPTPSKPKGELCVIAGGRLLYLGELVCPVGEDGAPSLPFVRQDALERADCFFGTSIVERCIPIQRAFNAVKNRKHEFLNRVAAGVMAVEDGSVDVESLETEGLAPGRVLVYRQGSTPPRLLDAGGVPSEFTVEEDRLLSEFISVSGVSELMRSSSIPSSITSGVALQLLIEQDDTRLSVTAENIRQAARFIGKLVLRLYRRYAVGSRVFRTVGEDGSVEAEAFTASELGSDDVVSETDNELDETPAQRRNMLFEIIKTGLFEDERGVLDRATRAKLLDALGMGGFERAADLSGLNVNRAGDENRRMTDGERVEVKEYDDHELHESEHIKFLLSRSFDKLKDRDETEKRILAHLRMHKQMLALSKSAEEGGGAKA